MDLGFETVHRLLTGGTVEQFEQTLSTLLGDFGANHFILAAEHDDESRTKSWVGGYPPQWVAHYLSEQYTEIDPAVLHARLGSMPYIWPSAQDLSSEDMHLTEKQVRLFREAREHGLHGGITIPLRDRSTTWGLLSVSFERRRDVHLAQRRMHELFFLAYQIQEASKRFWTVPGETELAPLSREEIEVLKLAAAGKKNHEIADALRVPERRVAYLMRKTAQALGVANRASAVAKSIMRGII